MAISYTIGGMMIFPAVPGNRKWTINQARGCLRRIADRFDLTLECIRRHYLGQRSPLGETLARYQDFFALFHDFNGYVEFFLLQDLVTADGTAVEFFMQFDEFKPPAVPRDLETYRDYSTPQHRLRQGEKRQDRCIRRSARIDLGKHTTGNPA